MSLHLVAITPQAIELSIRRRGRIQPYESIVPRSTALVVVDMQTGFVAPGAFEIPAARAIVPGVNQLAKALRAAGGTVVFVVSTYGEGADEDWPTFFNFVTRGEPSRRFRTAFANGSPEHSLWNELDRAPDDVVFAKNRLTPFADHERRFELMLRSRGLDTLLIVGTVTNVCCECTARDAALRDFKTIMISDANAARNDAEHNATLSIFLQAFGGVLTVNETVALIETGNRSA